MGFGIGRSAQARGHQFGIQHIVSGIHASISTARTYYELWDNACAFFCYRVCVYVSVIIFFWFIVYFVVNILGLVHDLNSNLYVLCLRIRVLGLAHRSMESIGLYNCLSNL